MPTIQELSTNARKRIASWNSAATFEDVEKTYVTHRMGLDLADLSSGTKWLVLGRKGAGKSAFVNKLEATLNESDIFEKQEFDPNLLGHRLAYFDKGFDISNASSVFKLDMLLLAAKELGYRVDDPELAKKSQAIGEYYRKASKKIEIKARSKVGRLLSFAASVLGLESVGKELNEMGIFDNPSIVADEVYSATKKLAKVIQSSNFSGRIYIVFDEIDLKISDYKQSPTYQEYLKMLKSLIAAASTFDDIRRNGVPIYPIVVLRDDIFQTIEVADRNKWERNSVRVLFGRSDLEEILRHRIKHELLASGFGNVVEGESFIQLWHRLVSKQFQINGRPLVEHFFERSMYRPRDVVQFLKLMCERTTHAKEPNERINAQIFREAKNGYSEYFWNELLDELGYAYPFAPRFQTLLRDIFFSKKGNRYNYNVYVSVQEAMRVTSQFCADLRHEGVSVSPDEMLQDFYRRSVVGIQKKTENGLRTFYFFQDQLDRDVSEAAAITLHRSLADYLIRRNRASGV